MSCELTLISSSTLRGQPAACDLTFQLDPKQLPTFSDKEIWKEIDNPLRDRVMMSWLFSYPVTQKILDNMLTQITEKVQQYLPSVAHTTSLLKTQTTEPTHQVTEQQAQDSTLEHRENDKATISDLVAETPKIVVGVTCPNGKHHSPCFVEKLRDTYQRDQTYNKRLIIHTEHWDVISHSPKKKKFAWYRTKIPSSYIHHVEMLTNNHLWLPFENVTSRQLEQAFREDPYCSMVLNPTEVVDFESGTVFNKQKRKSYYIRSSVLKVKTGQSLVKCRLVGDEAYKAAVKRFDAAGILFYSVHPRTGDAVFLLGHMTYGTYAWCDFGGLKSWKRLKGKENARHTAARECCEETLGVLGTEKALVDKLEDFRTNNVFKVVNEVYYYVSHFLRVPYKDYTKLFHEATKRQNNCLEIDELRWFTMSAMREAVHMALHNERVMIVSHLLEGDTLSPKTSELRVEFVHTLCIAEKLGILDSINYIAKQVHLSMQPPPARPVSYPKPKKSKSEQPQTTSKDLETTSKDTDTTSKDPVSTPDSKDQQTTSKGVSVGPRAVPDSMVVTNENSPEGTTDSPVEGIMESELGNCKEKADSTLIPLLDIVEEDKKPVLKSQSDCAVDDGADLTDFVSRSRSWSFESYVSSLPPEAVGDQRSEGSESRRPLLGAIRHRRKAAKVERKERSTKTAPVVNGKSVLYYGMGAGSFGV